MIRGRGPGVLGRCVARVAGRGGPRSRTAILLGLAAAIAVAAIHTARANVAPVPWPDDARLGGEPWLIELVAPGEPYGCPLTADGLSNLPLGKAPGRAVGFRVRAERDGVIAAVWVYVIAGREGYSGGDGGALRVEVRGDDGSAAHLPDDTIRGVGQAGELLGRWNRRIELDAPAAVRAGELVHLVFRNPADDPVADWVSLNALHVRERAPGQQPTVDDEDRAVLLKASGVADWTTTYTVPIYAIEYTDGGRQGQGYVDALSRSGVIEIGGPAGVRQRFTVTGPSRHVGAIAVRVARRHGDGGLTITLHTAAGEALAGGTVDAGAIGDEPTWITLPLAAPVELAAGVDHTLALDAPPGTTYTTVPLQQGDASGFDVPSLFTDGFAEPTLDGHPPPRHRADLDLPFYFAAAKR